MFTLDRMREKHNALTTQLAKQQAKRDKAIATLIRADAKLGSAIRAVARSAKRLDKAVAAATHTAGPTATVKPALIDKVAGKPVPTLKADDDVKEFFRRGQAAQQAVDAVIGKPRRKSRRTPDDFKADIEARKAD